MRFNIDESSQEAAIKSLLDINISDEEIANSIDAFIEMLGEYFDADRTYIFETDRENQFIVNTYEWVRKGITPHKNSLQKVPFKEFESWIQNLRTNGVTYIICDDNFKKNAPQIYDSLTYFGISSMIATPFSVSSNVIGFFGIDNPRKHTDQGLFVSVASSLLNKRVVVEKKKVQEQFINSVISSLSSAYLRIFYINIQEETYVSLNEADIYEIKVKNGAVENARERFVELAEYLVYPDQKDEMLEFTELTTMAERLKNRNSISCNFNGVYSGWCEATIIAAQRDSKGNVTHVIWAVKSIKNQKEQENKLTIQQKIVESLSNAYSNIYVIGKSNKISYAVKTKGFVPDELKGKAYYPYEVTAEAFLNGRVIEEDKEMMRNFLRWDNIIEGITNKFEYARTYRVLENGEIHQYQVIFKDIDNSDYFICGFQNIDNIIRSEKIRKEAIQQALDAAEHANKAKTIFLNNMSHDIRTPMNAILGFTTLATTHIDNKELVKEYLKKISTSGDHLLSLINDVLDMSRNESGKVKIEEKEMSLPELIQDIKTIIQPNLTNKKLNLFVDTCNVKHEYLIADRLRINQVLLNILSNSVKYTNNGGTISIRVSELPSYLENHALYEFRIKDNGIGISQEFQKHIFEAFTREDNRMVNLTQGTGLGMAITKNIVDMMGGTIEVESELAKGSEFIVTLNLKISYKNESKSNIEKYVGAKALIVDENPENCLAIGEMLDEIGLVPEWTTTGKEAIFRAKIAYQTKKEPYGVYIIDYSMNDLNGIETVKAIRREIGNDAPIIILTSTDIGKIEEEARMAGVTAFCNKPLFISDLKNVLSNPNNEYDDKIKSYDDFVGKKILLVEDNLLNQEIAQTLLEEAGFKVDIADDGQIAVDIMNKEDANKYDVILMDIQMPNMNGYEATKEIRLFKNKTKASKPIIAMTANAFQEDKEMAFEAGMNGFLSKPIKVKELFEMLARILK